MPKKSKINSENNQLYIRMVKVLKDYSDKFSNPIKHKELAEMDEYNKSLYFRMLCMLSQCEATTTDKQIWFLTRLLKGNIAEEELEEYTVKALEIETEDIEAFVDAFQGNIIKFYFVIDALIMLNLSEINNKQTEMIADIVRFLEISERDLSCIALLSKSILINDINAYDEAKELITNETKRLDLFEYIRNFYQGNYSLDENIVRYYSNIPMELELSGTFEYESIQFENCNIKINNELNFRGCKEVVFVNTHVTGKKIVFDRVSNVSFNGCELDNFKEGIARFNFVETLAITDCLITNSEVPSNYDGIFDVDNDVQSIGLFNNVVRNCLSQGGDVKDYVLFMSISSWRSGIITARHNEFVNCSRKGSWGSSFLFDCRSDVFAVNENNSLKNCHNSVQLMHG